MPFTGSSSSDEAFEKGPDGKIRLKPGRKKIDLSKLTDDDLRKLGIDPSLSKKEIARLLKVNFRITPELLRGLGIGVDISIRLRRMG